MGQLWLLLGSHFCFCRHSQRSVEKKACSRVGGDSLRNMRALRFSINAPMNINGTMRISLWITLWQLTAPLMLIGCHDSTSARAEPDAQANACPGVTVSSCPTIVPSFSTDISAIIEARCSSCHSPHNDAGLWPLNDRQSLYDWQAAILQVLRDCTQPPPSSRATLDLSERKALEGWLVCGAPDN